MYGEPVRQFSHGGACQAANPSIRLSIDHADRLPIMIITRESAISGLPR